MELLLKEKSSGYTVFRRPFRRVRPTSSSSSTPRETSFVTEGAKFTFAPVQGSLTARGPLLAQVALAVAAAEEAKRRRGGGTPFWVELSFALSPAAGARNDSLFSGLQPRYEWVAQGWSKCSRECGGGKQHVLLRWVRLI